VQIVPLDAATWNQINSAIGHLAYFSAALIVSAFAFMVGHAIIPSLQYTVQSFQFTDRFRPALYAIACASLLVAVWQVATFVGMAIPVLQKIYPRFLY
jgi:hypothetical protein